MSGGADRWGTASARALCALIRQPDLALGAEFTPTTFAVPWRALAERFRAWLDEAGSGQGDAAQRLVAFLDSIPDAELERVGISSRAWVVQRVQAAVKARPMGEGLVVLGRFGRFGRTQGRLARASSASGLPRAPRRVRGDGRTPH